MAFGKSNRVVAATCLQRLHFDWKTLSEFLKSPHHGHILADCKGHERHEANKAEHFGKEKVLTYVCEDFKWGSVSERTYGTDDIVCVTRRTRLLKS